MYLQEQNNFSQMAVEWPWSSNHWRFLIIHGSLNFSINHGLPRMKLEATVAHSISTTTPCCFHCSSWKRHFTSLLCSHHMIYFWPTSYLLGTSRKVSAFHDKRGRGTWEPSCNHKGNVKRSTETPIQISSAAQFLNKPAAF